MWELERNIQGSFIFVMCHNCLIDRVRENLLDGGCSPGHCGVLQYRNTVEMRDVCCCQGLTFIVALGMADNESLDFKSI